MPSTSQNARAQAGVMVASKPLTRLPTVLMPKAQFRVMANPAQPKGPIAQPRALTAQSATAGPPGKLSTQFRWCFFLVVILSCREDTPFAGLCLTALWHASVRSYIDTIHIFTDIANQEPPHHTIPLAATAAVEASECANLLIIGTTSAAAHTQHIHISYVHKRKWEWRSGLGEGVPPPPPIRTTHRPHH